MQKDAFYFSHDSNAKDDPKIMLLIEDLGLEGYGIFWVLIELLRDQPDYRYHLGLIKAIARKYNTTEIKVKQVITGYKLFVIDEDMYFYSESLNRRMDKMNNLREKRSKAGVKGNQIRWEQKSQSDNNAIAIHRNKKKGKEIKEKEIKEEEKEKEKEQSNKFDYSSFLKTYNDNCINLKRAIKLTDKRKRLIKSFIKNNSDISIIEYLEKVNRAEFLNGSSGWIADFDFIFKPDNIIKILEGKYDVDFNKKNNNNKNKPVQATNYEQREYDDDFFDSLYDNIKFIKE